MRALLAPAGSRGDVQPLLALGVGLRAAGHDVLVATAPNFAADAFALGLPFAPVGRDVLRIVQASRDTLHGPLQGLRFLTQHYHQELKLQFDGLFGLEPRFDLVVGAGAQVAASSLAESWRVPYRYIAYFPELLPSRGHAPVFIPYALPGWMNGALWATFSAVYQRTLGKAHNDERVRHGLSPVPNVLESLGGERDSLLAIDPELAPLPPDLHIQTIGSLHLADPRPLPQEVHRFVHAGDPPVYLGFGSMPDPSPARTTALLEEAVRTSGVRAIISTGWANLGANSTPHPRILFAGALNHGTLFPLLATAVHHGGAGTTAAAARAGIAQILVPHSFDQFAWGRRTVTAGVSPGFIPRSELDASRLAQLLRQAVENPRYRQAANALSLQLRARNSLAQAITCLEHAAR